MRCDLFQEKALYLYGFPSRFVMMSRRARERHTVDILRLSEMGGYVITCYCQFPLPGNAVNVKSRRSFFPLRDIPTGYISTWRLGLKTVHNSKDRSNILNIIFRNTDAKNIPFSVNTERVSFFLDEPTSLVSSWALGVNES